MLMTPVRLGGWIEGSQELDVNRAWMRGGNALEKILTSETRFGGPGGSFSVLSLSCGDGFICSLGVGWRLGSPGERIRLSPISTPYALHCLN